MRPETFIIFVTGRIRRDMFDSFKRKNNILSLTRKVLATQTNPESYILFTHFSTFLASVINSQSSELVVFTASLRFIARMNNRFSNSVAITVFVKTIHEL